MAIALQVRQILVLRSALFPWPIALCAIDDPSPSRYGAAGFTEWRSSR